MPSWDLFTRPLFLPVLRGRVQSYVPLLLCPCNTGEPMEETAVLQKLLYC